MTEGGISSYQCIKCSAPVGTTGGRCPFCGTQQPTVAPSEPFRAATVGLSDINRAKMATLPPPRPPQAALQPAVLVGIGVAAGFVMLAATGFILFRGKASAPPPDAVAAVASAPPLASAPRALVGGIALPDAAKLDATDTLPQIRRRLASWDPDPLLLDITVAHARGALLDVGEPGPQVVYRFVTSRHDPRAAKGQEKREGMQVTLRHGAPDPEPLTVAPTEKPTPEPNCVWSAAYRTAISAGLPSDVPLDAHYRLNTRTNEATWVFTVPDQPGAVRELDGMTCAVKTR